MPTFNMAAQTPNGQPGGSDASVYSNGLQQSFPGRECKYNLLKCYPSFNLSLTQEGPLSNQLPSMKDIQKHFHFPDLTIGRWFVSFTDALHLSIPGQGLPNGDAALQHAAAYQGMQAYPGVGKSNLTVFR